MKRFLSSPKFAFLTILILAIFFRFYRLLQLQYYSPDDEIFTLVLNRIVRQHVPMLVSPNTTIAVSLGSFFHLFSAPLFYLTSFNPIAILATGSVVGILSTIAIFFVGRELKNTAVGLIASFLYASSFLVSLSDRRWWPLTLDPLLVLIATYSLIKVTKRRYLYTLPLAISASIAWHADPSLAIIPLAALAVFLLFKLPLFHRRYLPAITYLLFSISPLFLFELRHPSSISHPIAELFLRLTKPKGDAFAYVQSYNPFTTINDFTRAFFPKPSFNLEGYLSPFPQILSPAFSPWSPLIIVVLLAFPLCYHLIRRHRPPKPLLVTYLILVSFIIGTIFFNLIFKHNIHQHYYVVIWPIAFLLAAVTLERASRIHLAIPALFFVAFSFANFRALQLSSFVYPLHDKVIITDQVISKLDQDTFSLHVIGGDKDLDGIGGIFFARNHFPQNFGHYLPLDWVYRAYSLYPLAIKPDYTQDQAVLIYPSFYQPDLSPFVHYRRQHYFHHGNIQALILTRTEDENPLSQPL